MIKISFLFAIGVFLSCSDVETISGVTEPKKENSHDDQSMTDNENAVLQIKKDTIVLDILIWKKGELLNWDHFRGIVPKGDDHKAMTYSRIKRNREVFADSIVYQITAEFSVKDSWVALKNDTLLGHEQLHFDITELYARKLRRAFGQQVLSTPLQTVEKLNEIYDKIANEERRNCNSEYDKATKHGIIYKEQKYWEAKIANELKELEAYSSTKVVVKRTKKQ